MKRFQEDRRAMARGQRLYAAHCPERPRELGRFRKRHALDCGKVRCGVCHGNKYPKRERHEHEVRADESFREQVRERVTVREAGARDCPLCDGWGWFETHAVEGGWSTGPTCHWCGGTGKVIE